MAALVLSHMEKPTCSYSTFMLRRLFIRNSSFEFAVCDMCNFPTNIVRNCKPHEVTCGDHDVRRKKAVHSSRGNYQCLQLHFRWRPSNKECWKPLVGDLPLYCALVESILVAA